MDDLNTFQRVWRFHKTRTIFRCFRARYPQRWLPGNQQRWKNLWYGLLKGNNMRTCVCLGFVLFLFLTKLRDWLKSIAARETCFNQSKDKCSSVDQSQAKVKLIVTCFPALCILCMVCCEFWLVHSFICFNEWETIAALFVTQVMGSNSVKAWIFFRISFLCCLSSHVLERFRITLTANGRNDHSTMFSFHLPVLFSVSQQHRIVLRWHEWPELFCSTQLCTSYVKET